MCAALVLWIFQSIIFLSYGRLLLLILQRIGFATQKASSPILQLLTGLVVVTTLASVLSLFVPLSFWALLLITLGALVIIWMEWKRNKLHGIIQYLKNLLHQKIWLMISVMFILLVLEISTSIPNNSDTGLYHAQAIHWIETYPAVPGLGNLYQRFAYNSSWLTTNALFSFAFLKLQSFHTLPGFLMTSFVLYAIQAMRKMYEHTSLIGDWFAAFLLPLVFLQLLRESASPGTDLPGILLIWFILAEWIKEIETPGDDQLRSITLALLAVFTVTIKLSTLPILLVSVFLLYRKLSRQSIRLAGIGTLMAALILLPWLARNIILSGYLVYPEPAIDLFTFDWKIPREELVAEKEIIQSWARLPRMDVKVVQNMRLSEWFQPWFINLPRSSQGMLGVIAVSPLIIIISLAVNIIQKAASLLLLKYLPIYAVLYTGIIFWLFTAPGIRFGNSLVMAAFIATFFPMFLWLQNLSHFWINKLLVIFLFSVCLFLYGFLHITNDMKTLPDRLVFPADYPALSTSPCNLKNKTIFCADWYSSCGYHVFPCVPQVNSNVVMRGKSFRDGFRLEIP